MTVYVLLLMLLAPVSGCTPGEMIDSATMVCVPCEPGTFQPAIEPDIGMRCLYCPPGTAQPDPGQAECDTCMPPAILSTNDRTACKGNYALHQLTRQGHYELRVDLADWEGNSKFAIYRSFRVEHAKDMYTLRVSGYCGNAGNYALHQLTRQGHYELRVDLADWEGNSKFAIYRSFRVEHAKDMYTLRVSGYCGNAGDTLGYHNGKAFSTKDKDNDEYSENCAIKFAGAWWYASCHKANLNGVYLEGNYTSYADGVNWDYWKGDRYSLKKTEMKIRRIY